MDSDCGCYHRSWTSFFGASNSNSNTRDSNHIGCSRHWAVAVVVAIFSISNSDSNGTSDFTNCFKWYTSHLPIVTDIGIVTRQSYQGHWPLGRSIKFLLTLNAKAVPNSSLPFTGTYISDD